LVERDLPLPLKKGSSNLSDLDVLAIKHDEVYLVNCKDAVADPSQGKKILHNLESAEEFVRNKYQILDTKQAFKRLLVYEFCDRKTLTMLQANNVECRTLMQVLNEYVKALENFMDGLRSTTKPAKGKRWYRTGNLRSYDKLIVYFLNNGLLDLKCD